MMRASVVPGLVWLLCSACAASSQDDASGPVPCTPGEQRACACAGGSPPGVQICGISGDQFGPCMGCAGDSTSSTDDASGSTLTDPTDPTDPTTPTTEDPSETADSGSADGTTGIPGDGIPDDPPQAVPPAPPPDGSGIVEQVAAEHPDWLTGSCVEQGGTNDFLFEVVRRLRMQDDRWGLNWKRGVVDDLSQDAIDYHWGEGLSEGSTDVYIIDIIGGHCPEDGTPPQAAWIDVTQATLDAGTIGMWTLAGEAL